MVIGQIHLPGAQLPGLGMYTMNRKQGKEIAQ
jgi:hypothetical protein